MLCLNNFLATLAYLSDTPLVPLNFGGRVIQMSCLCCKGQQIMRK